MTTLTTRSAPSPPGTRRNQRAAWHEAFLALGPADEPDVRAMRDGRLWLIRDTYAAETAWAPRHVGRELRLARLGAANADLGAIRAAAEPTPPARPATMRAPGGTRNWPPPTGPWATATGARNPLRPDHGRPADWEHATAHSRRLAIAADAELRRRHPDLRIDAAALR